jgi:hypothetical protein
LVLRDWFPLAALQPKTRLSVASPLMHVGSIARWYCGVQFRLTALDAAQHERSLPVIVYRR